VWPAALGIGAIAVIGAATAVVVARPFGDPDRCTAADLRVTYAGLTAQEDPDIDSSLLVIRTRHECMLAGPLRLEVRDNDGPWTRVPVDPGPTRTRGWVFEGQDGAQTATPLRLVPRVTYRVSLAWVRSSRPCPTRDTRVAGPGLVVAIGSLPQWCGQPVSMSNTFPPARVRFGLGVDEPTHSLA
jgi:hypothetical protein